jgi:hypothetical protein
MPVQASHCALYSRSERSGLVDPLKRACSNIVRLLSRCMSDNRSKSELRDSNRRQNARSSSRPSFFDFFHVLLSQALRSKVTAGKVGHSDFEHLIVACFFESRMPARLLQTFYKRKAYN